LSGIPNFKGAPNTLRKWDRNGILEAVRFGQRGDRRYKKEAVLNLMETKSKLQ